MSRSTDTIVDEVYRLLDGESYTPGAHLDSEPALAVRFHVSRAVMREALRVLEREGAVTVRPGVGGGVFAAEQGVRPLIRGLEVVGRRRAWTPALVRDAHVEILAHLARLAALRAEPEEVDALDASNRAWSDSLEREDAEGGAAARQQFDEGLLEAAHSPVLAALARALESLLSERGSTVSPAKDAPATGRVAYSHGFILEALRRRAPEEAADRMRQHITTGDTIEAGGIHGNG